MLKGKIKYTEKEIEILLKSIVLLIDSREQVNDHIIAYLDKNGLPYVKRKLEYGDYSFMIPKNEELGISNDITFEDEIVIERKNSCDEIASNLSSDRTRIEREFALCKAKIFLMIEDTYHNMVTGNYKSNYNKKALAGSIHSFAHKYNINFTFIDKEDSGKFIYATFYYYLRNQIK